jgi:hypothetical protein
MPTTEMPGPAGETFQSDPHWRDCILFDEYFHGDNGAGLGASHQTGWTGAVAKLIELGPARWVAGPRWTTFPAPTSIGCLRRASTGSGS